MSNSRVQIAIVSKLFYFKSNARQKFNFLAGVFDRVKFGPSQILDMRNLFIKY